MFKELNLEGCNKKYLIYDDGRVFDIKENKFRVPKENHKGYYRISFYINGKYKCKFVHRLVLMTFNPVDGMDNLQVNHIDGDKHNNNLNNLEWCTQKENIEHAVRTGLFDNCASYGDKSHYHKLTEKIVKEIKKDLEMKELSIRKIAKKYNISPSTIFQIKKGNYWKQI